jgi:hypothetical protein
MGAGDALQVSVRAYDLSGVINIRAAELISGAGAQQTTARTCLNGGRGRRERNGEGYRAVSRDEQREEHLRAKRLRNGISGRRSGQ